MDIAEPDCQSVSSVDLVEDATEAANLAAQYGNKWKDDTIPILVVDEIAGEYCNGMTVMTIDTNNVTHKLIIIEAEFASSFVCANVILHEIGHIVGLNHVESDIAVDILHPSRRNQLCRAHL